MKIRIKESNMVFEFDEDKVFKIENSNLHKSIGNGIKTVELIVALKKNEISFVEAKSSSPQPRPGNKERFDEFIDEITQKFLHSFNMYLSAILKRNRYDEISEYLHIDSNKAKFKFILVINGHKIEWLLYLKDAINKSMLSHNKIWKSSIIVMNDEMARDYKLII